MGYLLYKRNYATNNCNIDNGYKIDTFVPKIGKLYLPTEKKNKKTTLARLLFWILSLGKAKIVCIKDERGGEYVIVLTLFLVYLNFLLWEKQIFR